MDYRMSSSSVLVFQNNLLQFYMEDKKKITTLLNWIKGKIWLKQDKDDLTHITAWRVLACVQYSHLQARSSCFVSLKMGLTPLHFTQFQHLYSSVMIKSRPSSYILKFIVCYFHHLTWTMSEDTHFFNSVSQKLFSPLVYFGQSLHFACLALLSPLSLS